MGTDDMIAVLPKNYRSIALYAIGAAHVPQVLVNRRRIEDFSDRGPLTQAGIQTLQDFEIRDGTVPILGFHDHPNEMWVSHHYRNLAEHCQKEGWLTIENE